MEKRKAKYIELKTSILTVETSIIHNKFLDYENFFWLSNKNRLVRKLSYSWEFLDFEKEKNFS